MESRQPSCAAFGGSSALAFITESENPFRLESLHFFLQEESQRR